MDIDTEITVKMIKDLIAQLTESMHKTYADIQMWEHLIERGEAEFKATTVDVYKSEVSHSIAHAKSKVEVLEMSLMHDGLRMAEAEILLEEKLRSEQ